MSLYSLPCLQEVDGITVVWGVRGAVGLFPCEGMTQVSVDNVIAGIVEMEELEKDLTAGETLAKPAATDPLPDMGDQVDNEPAAMKVSLETKTYVLKKRPDSKQTFKSSECKAVEMSIHKLNEHHRHMHNPQMCGICNRTIIFNL